MFTTVAVMPLPQVKLKKKGVTDCSPGYLVYNYSIYLDMSAIAFASEANCPFSFMLVIDCKLRSAGKKKKIETERKKTLLKSKYKTCL